MTSSIEAIAKAVAQLSRDRQRALSYQLWQSVPVLAGFCERQAPRLASSHCVFPKPWVRLILEDEQYIFSDTTLQHKYRCLPTGSSSTLQGRTSLGHNSVAPHWCIILPSRGKLLAALLAPNTALRTCQLVQQPQLEPRIILRMVDYAQHTLRRHKRCS